MSTMLAVTTVTYPHAAPMPKVKETRTQDHLQEKVMHLNLADYLYNLEAIAKETGELDMQPEDQLRYELRERRRGPL